MMLTNARVVVIGGGVVGLSTAYQLAIRQQERVLLLEKDHVGAGASGRAAGIGSHLLWSETGIRARCQGFQLFRQFSDEWDDYHFHCEHGCLNLFTPESWPERETLLPLYEKCGVPYEVLDARAIRTRWPTLDPPAHLIGLQDPFGGYSEPSEYIEALRRRVRSLGVEVLEGESVIEFQRRGDAITGVRTQRRVIEAQAVVSTVNVWSWRLWRELGLQLPVKHFVHQRYVSAPLKEPFVAPPVNADPYGGYVRPAAGNRILMGVETPDRDEHRVSSLEFRMDELRTPISVRDESRERMMQFVPLLRNIAWESEHVGLISFASDGEPVLGPVPQAPGLYVAAALHSGGFSYNAVAGQLLAELVIDGKASINIDAFSPTRFDPLTVEEHLSTTIPQRAAVRRRH